MSQNILYKKNAPLDHRLFRDWYNIPHLGFADIWHLVSRLYAFYACLSRSRSLGNVVWKGRHQVIIHVVWTVWCCFRHNHYHIRVNPAWSRLRWLSGIRSPPYGSSSSELRNDQIEAVCGLLSRMLWSAFLSPEFRYALIASLRCCFTTMWSTI